MRPSPLPCKKPSSAARVRACVERIVRVARHAETVEDARARADLLEEVPEFKSKYKLMYERLTDPQIARNRDHVDVVLSMIALRDRVDAGTLSEEGAQRLVAEEALTKLVAQAHARSSREE